jgi:hypothetical protein
MTRRATPPIYSEWLSVIGEIPRISVKRLI